MLTARFHSDVEGHRKCPPQLTFQFFVVAIAGAYCSFSLLFLGPSQVPTPRPPFSLLLWPSRLLTARFHACVWGHRKCPPQPILSVFSCRHDGCYLTVFILVFGAIACAHPTPTLQFFGGRRGCLLSVFIPVFGAIVRADPMHRAAS